VGKSDEMLERHRHERENDKSDGRAVSRLTNRAHLPAIAEDVANRAVVTVSSLPNCLSVRGCQDVFLLDDTAAGTGELVHAVVLHSTPPTAKDCMNRAYRQSLRPPQGHKVCNGSKAYTTSTNVWIL